MPKDPPITPIPFLHFPPDVLTFYISTQREGTRTEVTIRDSFSTLLQLRNEYLTLTPKEQRLWIATHVIGHLS